MARGASTQDIVDKAIGLQNVVVLENVHQQDLLQNRIQSVLLFHAVSTTYLFDT